MSELAQIDTTELEERTALVTRAVGSLMVRNVDEHKAALEMLGAVMGAESRVKAFFKPALDAAMDSKRKAEAARQAVITMQDHFLGPILDARNAVSEKCKVFEVEERRAAEIVQAQLRADALAKQEQQRELDAAMADDPEAAEEILTEPLAPPPVAIVKPEVAKVAGISTRETWVYLMRDKAKFLAWAAKPDNNMWAAENEVMLNSWARNTKGKAEIPGVEAVPKLTHTRR